MESFFSSFFPYQTTFSIVFIIGNLKTRQAFKNATKVQSFPEDLHWKKLFVIVKSQKSFSYGHALIEVIISLFFYHVPQRVAVALFCLSLFICTTHIYNSNIIQYLIWCKRIIKLHIHYKFKGCQPTHSEFYLYISLLISFYGCDQHNLTLVTDIYLYTMYIYR